MLASPETGADRLGSARSKMVVTMGCSSNKHSAEKGLLQDLPLYTFVNPLRHGDTDQGTLGVPRSLGAGH